MHAGASATFLGCQVAIWSVPVHAAVIIARLAFFYVRTSTSAFALLCGSAIEISCFGEPATRVHFALRHGASIYRLLPILCELSTSSILR
jgi:hypothetical protein